MFSPVIVDIYNSSTSAAHQIYHFRGGTRKQGTPTCHPLHLSTWARSEQSLRLHTRSGAKTHSSHQSPFRCRSVGSV
ncbi:hypothetical protein M378DRAFT_159742 [Amanita muscaria Koide BX008]|uniref:Uncharacterized protein n=1 Tax=Amanita muscaria (strain Koide BX008) TaxID=946122 RepID=A0A0C2WZR2_AMAMK|nr:hypothetical protein M378DRAFT_159742 [Amanita muscaria Koide BX008]